MQLATSPLLRRVRSRVGRLLPVRLKNHIRRRLNAIPERAQKRINHRDELEEKVRTIGPWFHQIDVGLGIRTRSVHASDGAQTLDHPAPRWEKIKGRMPADLTGQRILDLGCSDGFFAIEMARRGAQEVVAIDLARDAVDRLAWLAHQLDLPQIKAAPGNIYALPHDIGRFDFVFMFALLYHLKAPLLGLEVISTLTDELYMETIADLDEERSHLRLQAPRQGVHAIPKWIPTTRCIKDMLVHVGFDQLEILAPGTDDHRPIYRAWKSTPSPEPAEPDDS